MRGAVPNNAVRVREQDSFTRTDRERLSPTGLAHLCRMSAAVSWSAPSLPLSPPAVVESACWLRASGLPDGAHTAGQGLHGQILGADGSGGTVLYGTPHSDGDIVFEFHLAAPFAQTPWRNAVALADAASRQGLRSARWKYAAPPGEGGRGEALAAQAVRTTRPQGEERGSPPMKLLEVVIAFFIALGATAVLLGAVDAERRAAVAGAAQAAAVARAQQDLGWLRLGAADGALRRCGRPAVGWGLPATPQPRGLPAGTAFQVQVRLSRTRLTHLCRVRVAVSWSAPSLPHSPPAVVQSALWLRA